MASSTCLVIQCCNVRDNDLIGTSFSKTREYKYVPQNLTNLFSLVLLNWHQLNHRLNRENEADRVLASEYKYISSKTDWVD